MVVTLLTGMTCAQFFTNVTKAKTAKVVRAVLEAILLSGVRRRSAHSCISALR